MINLHGDDLMRGWTKAGLGCNPYTTNRQCITVIIKDQTRLFSYFNDNKWRYFFFLCNAF
jgi:hypothetical protein